MHDLFFTPLKIGNFGLSFGFTLRAPIPTDAYLQTSHKSILLKPDAYGHSFDVGKLSCIRCSMKNQPLEVGRVGKVLMGDDARPRI